MRIPAQMAKSRGHDADFLRANHNQNQQPTTRPISARVIHKQPSSLQRQIERQRQLTRSAASKHKSREKDKADPAEQTPLVQQNNSSNGDSSYSAAHPDVRQQLQKDGYRLDEVPDDEEVDLMIVPRPLEERPTCEPCACTIS